MAVSSMRLCSVIVFTLSVAKGGGLCLFRVPHTQPRGPDLGQAPGSRVHLQHVWGRRCTIRGPLQAGSDGRVPGRGTAAQAATSQPPPGQGGQWS